MRSVTIREGSLCLFVALLAMFGVVVFIVDAADRLLWVVPAGVCLAVSAYTAARVFCRIFYGR